MTQLGYCLCGCGGKTSISRHTKPKCGYVAGQPRSWIKGHRHKSPKPEYEIDPASGCWVWQRHIHQGYGYAGKRRAHRLIYERHRGPYAFSVLGAWGFTFKNVLVWCKPGLGMGGTFRNAHELVLVGERGLCELKRRDVGTWHVWPNPRENSAKPEGFLDLVESVSHPPYLELFARRARFNWDYWGDESLGTAEMPGEAA
jgi:hypothetical protein